MVLLLPPPAEEVAGGVDGVAGVAGGFGVAGGVVGVAGVGVEGVVLPPPVHGLLACAPPPWGCWLPSGCCLYSFCRR